MSFALLLWTELQELWQNEFHVDGEQSEVLENLKTKYQLQ
jgi:hypothetical protein